MSVRLRNTPLMPLQAKVNENFVWSGREVLEQDPVYRGYFSSKSSCCCSPCHDAFDLRLFAKAIKDNLCPICHKPFQYIMQTRTIGNEPQEILWPLLPHSTHNTPRSYNIHSSYNSTPPLTTPSSSSSVHSHSSYNSTPPLTTPSSYDSGRSVHESAYRQPQSSRSHGGYNPTQSAPRVLNVQQPAPAAPRLLDDPTRRKMIPSEIPTKQSIFTRQQHTKLPEYIYMPKINHQTVW